MSILGNVDWQKQGSEAFTYLKGLGNKVKQMALQLTEVEIKVEDATNNEPWGPHGKDMAGEKRHITGSWLHLFVLQDIHVEFLAPNAIKIRKSARTQTRWNTHFVFSTVLSIEYSAETSSRRQSKYS